MFKRHVAPHMPCFSAALHGLPSLSTKKYPQANVTLATLLSNVSIPHGGAQLTINGQNDPGQMVDGVEHTIQQRSVQAWRNECS